MKNLLIAAAFILALSGCKSGEKPSAVPAAPADTAYTVPDDAAITKAVHEAYAAISFKKGEQPRYSEIPNYFIPQAQLINFRTDSADITGMNNFVTEYKHFITDAKVQLFYEEELFGRNEQFGRVAQRISTYVTYLNTRDSIAERGVNSFQLIKTKAGWKVSSIIWDVEKKTLPVPAYYLKK